MSDIIEQAVRALHYEVPGDLGDDRTWCSGCDVSWPCNTARALDGELS